MDFERPHRTSSELFICFTSRPSFSLSSSMKISSKVPILSPGRSDKYREQPTLSFSSSLNRRLGSMKGEQASPMFRKRGCGGGGGGGFDNAEPSSPKVTCIGQVRVKTKKQGKKMMNLGKRERNPKWVHLPLTICEALRDFGAEFSCLLPCGGGKICASSKARGVKRRSMSSCGAAFVRWLMVEEEDEEEKRRVEIGEEEEKKGSAEVEEEERFSICIPPKNALLLMRCRSEPLRMSALANRFWDSPIDDGGEDEVSTEDEECPEEELEIVESKIEVEEEGEGNITSDEESSEKDCQTRENDDQSLVLEENTLEENRVEIVLDQANEGDQWGLVELFEEEEENPQWTPLKQEEQWDSADIVEETAPKEEVLEEIVTNDSTSEEQKLSGSIGDNVENSETEEADIDKEIPPKDEVEEIVTDDSTEQNLQSLNGDNVEKSEMEEQIKTENTTTGAVLPDCLLMMMCEPKLSMEVSKETWVCSTDFIIPSQNQPIKNDGGNEVSANEDMRNVDPREQLNPQSKCMVSMVEQKLMNAVAYEPFVLTRCKSEPLRSSSRLAPESYFWKNTQREPHSGVGF